MQKLISNSGKKQATIKYTINDGFIVTIEQVINTGIGIEYDYFTSKMGFKNNIAATKWALKQMN